MFQRQGLRTVWLTEDEENRTEDSWVARTVTADVTMPPLTLTVRLLGHLRGWQREDGWQQ